MMNVMEINGVKAVIAFDPPRRNGQRRALFTWARPCRIPEEMSEMSAKRALISENRIK